MQSENSPTSFSEPEYKHQIRDFIAIVRKRIWWVVAVFVVVVGFVAADNFTATPIYRSTAQVLIKPDDPKVIEFEAVEGARHRRSRYYTTQYKLIKSRDLARRIVNHLNLTEQVGFGIPREKSGFSLMEVAQSLVAKGFQYVRGLAEGRVVETETAAKYPTLSNIEKRAVATVSGGLSVEPVRRSRRDKVEFLLI